MSQYFPHDMQKYILKKAVMIFRFSWRIPL